jgi:hypothetical protein
MLSVPWLPTRLWPDLPMNPQTLPVSIDPVRGIVRVRFGPAGEPDPGLRRRFIGRMFCCEEVCHIDFHRDPHEAEVRLARSPAAARDVLRNLSQALGGNRCLAVPSDALARLPMTVRRIGGRLTTWRVVPLTGNRIRFSHPRLRPDRKLARRCQQLALAQPGVRQARLTGWRSDLVVHVDPGLFAGDPLVMELQHEVDHGPGGRMTSPWEMTGTSATLCVAAAADLAVSALAPISAVLLVGTNLRTLKSAVVDVMRGRISLPVVAAAIVFGTLATGQFLASGIMAWSFDFWRRRHRRDIEVERRLLIEGAVPVPLASESAAADPPPTFCELAVGSEVLLRPGDVVPADGRIVGGGGVIDDRSVSGVAGARRVAAGDLLPAGAVVLGGGFSVVAEKPLAETRLATIGRMLEEATHWRPGHHAPTRQAEEFVEKLAVPTLATAGIGLLAGDLGTAVAVMRPDYANAEAISGSFEDLDAVSRGLAAGCVVRSPRKLDMLAQVDTIVLFPDSDLGRGRLDVTRIVRGVSADQAISAAADGMHREAIRWAASLAVHLADERREALAALAADRGIALLAVAPESFGDVAAVRIVGRVGDREIALRDVLPERDDSRPCVLEVDSQPVATFEFSRSQEPRAAAVLDRLRETFGIRTFLVAAEGDRACGELAATIHCDGVVSVGRQSVQVGIDQLVQSGSRVACIGSDGDLIQAGGRPQVSIELGGGGVATAADIVVLAPDLSRLTDLVMAGRERIRRRAVSRRLTILPNALCVAGAFLLGFTSIVVAVVCNLSTLGMYRLATRSLSEPQRPRRLTDRVRSLRRIS